MNNSFMDLYFERHGCIETQTEGKSGHFHSFFFAILIILAVLYSFTSRAEEYVAFGSYPQTEVAASSELRGASYDMNGDAVIQGKKYRRSKDKDGEYHYFEYAPILWSEMESGIYVARDILDCQQYDRQEKQLYELLGVNVPVAEKTSWDKCSLHSWLQNEFSNTAFSEEEKNALQSIGLLPFQYAHSLYLADDSKTVWQKTCSDYARIGGVIHFSGIGKWFLQDVDADNSSYVYYVNSDGKPHGLTEGILVNEEGIGVVPCMTVSPEYSFTRESVDETEKTTLYLPGGTVVSVGKDEAANYLANGWYQSVSEAKEHLSEEMNARFMHCAVYSDYEPYVEQYATVENPCIYLAYDKKNLTGLEIMAFIKPLVDNLLTGDQRDHMSFHIEFPYDEGFRSQTRDGFGYAEHTSHVLSPVAESYYTSWSGLARPNASAKTATHLAGTQATEWYFTLYLRLNGSADYSVRESNYFSKLHEIAGKALAYSDRPLGQVEYIRQYLAENVHYQEQGSNTPYSVWLDGNGVCGSYANAFSDLCYLLGIPCFEVTNGRSANHAWNRIYIEGAWYDLDNTSISSGDYKVNGSTRHFDPSGFHDSEARADNVDFLWTPYTNTTDLHREPFDVDKETFLSLMQMYEKDLPVLYKSNLDNP